MTLPRKIYSLRLRFAPAFCGHSSGGSKVGEIDNFGTTDGLKTVIQQTVNAKYHPYSSVGTDSTYGKCNTKIESCTVQFFLMTHTCS